jgi:alanyl-tRNA synthetase
MCSPLPLLSLSLCQGAVAGTGLNSYFQSFESLKRSVVGRFKLEQHRVKHLEYLEREAKLTEEIKQAERANDKKKISKLNGKLKVAAAAAAAGVNVSEDEMAAPPVEKIRCQAKELYEELEAKERQLISEDELEASMLCEVERLHLLNLLRVFEVKLEWGDDDHDQLIAHLQQQIAVLESDLNAKVAALCWMAARPISSRL